MDPSTANWLSEILEMDDPALNYQWPMMNSSIDQSVNNDISFGHEASQSTSRILKPSLQLHNKDNSRLCIFGQETSQKSSSSPSQRIISFGISNENSNFPAGGGGGGKQSSAGKPKYTVKTESEEIIDDFCATAIISSINHAFGDQQYGFEPFYKKGCYRTPLQAQDHVLAERKRRQKLSEQFISLAAIIPGLKKLDKASVIGGAIMHIKHLEERIKLLDEEKEKKRKPQEESTVSGKRPRTTTTANIYHNYDDVSSSGENINGSDNSSCDQQSSSGAEVEVRTSGGEVLIRVLCKKHRGIMDGFFAEMEKIHLSISSCSFIPFGDEMLLINAVGQVDEEFSMSAEDLANHIPQAMLKLFG